MSNYSIININLDIFSNFLNELYRRKKALGEANALNRKIATMCGGMLYIERDN